MILEKARAIRQKKNRGQARNGDHILVFSHEEHRELEARILSMKAGDQFPLRFGQIERHAIGLRDGRRDIAEETNNLCPDVPVPDVSALAFDDAVESERIG